MKLILKSIFGMVLATAGFSEVVRCELVPASKSNFVSGRLNIYHHEDFVHSAFLEARTNYGDDLPYLFLCGVNCIMDIEGDDYLYSLRFSGETRSPEQVTLHTESRTDNFRSSDMFQVRDCAED